MNFVSDWTEEEVVIYHVHMSDAKPKTVMPPIENQTWVRIIKAAILFGEIELVCIFWRQVGKYEWLNQSMCKGLQENKAQKNNVI